MNKYALYWRNFSCAKCWNYGGTYATIKLALKNAKKELTGIFEYRIENADGSIAQYGTARRNKR